MWRKFYYSNIIGWQIKWKCMSHFKHYIGEMPGFAQNLQTVGEAGTVKIKADSTPKLEDHSVHCLFAGYSLTHPTRCYRLYDSKTHRVCISCDVVWRCSIRKQAWWGNYIWTILVLQIGQPIHKGSLD